MHDPVQILLVEDSPGDVRLTQVALKRAGVQSVLHVARNGEEALEFLKGCLETEGGTLPDMVLTDLNMPVMGGLELLRHIKGDPALLRIPVVILSTSDAPGDIEQSYELNASCYVRKPVELDGFLKVMKAIEDFWLSVVRFPGSAVRQ
ncbi:MAG: response regulator [Planctomycetota bacterium]|jgi:CheY-like chemotaxis protein